MKSFEERLERESTAWVAEQLITDEQRTRLLARHPAQGVSTRRFLGIVAAIGGAMLLVGVSLVVKANWQEIGDWVKIGGLVGLLVACYVAGWRFKMEPGSSPRTGDALLMMGAVCFLLGIALVSQVFHIDERPANGVLLWWAGIAVVPWLTRAKGAQFVSTAAGVTWLGMELNAADSWLRIFAAEDGRWHYAVYLFAGAAFLVGLGMLLVGFGLRGGKHGDFAGLHEKWGLVVMAGALYVSGFSWTREVHATGLVFAARWQPVLVLAGLALVSMAYAWRSNRGDVTRLGGWLALGLVPVFGRLLGVNFGDNGWLVGGLSCLAMFALNFGMIRAGLATGREGWINLGIAGIALNLVTRYFVLFGTMLEGGVFFIVTGALVLGLGFMLERKRRALVGSVRGEVVS